MGTITLSTKQQRQAEILGRLAAESLTTVQAAELMNKSARHVRRLLARYREDGLQTLQHGNRGRAPKNKTPDEVKAKLQALCGPDGVYRDFNTCHLSELLKEREDMDLPRSTLDRLLKEAGLKKPRKRKVRVTRVRRERCPAFGQMLQIDGSPHDWLEGRGPRMSLMGAIDDATGRVLHARFHPTEDQKGYLLMLRSLCKEYGIPMTIYHDRHSILLSHKEPTLDEQLRGEKPMSQVQRVMETLGIEAIPAGSPQAKGRVERLWRTLQDRLTREMRLGEVADMEGANAFLPEFLEKHNVRFGQEPKDKEDAFEPLPEGFDVDRCFSVREERKVNNDHTLSFRGQILQLHKKDCKPNLPGTRVHVHVTPEGETLVYDGDKRLSFHIVVSRPANLLIPKASCAPGSAGAEEAFGIGKPPSNVDQAQRKSTWMDGFKPANNRPGPKKDLNVYNKLSAQEGHFP